MKICIIGLTRSRSTVFLESISDFFKLPIIGRFFNEKLPYLLPNRNWMADQSAVEVPGNHWEMVNHLLDSIENTDSGVIRYHPDQLSFIPYSGMLIDFELFNFKQYDKIYFTTRQDISAMISSRFVAAELDQWTYFKKSEVCNSIAPKTIDDAGQYHVKLALYNEIIVGLLKDYFFKNDIHYEQVDYKDIPTYIEQHFPGSQGETVETNYEYADIVTNYDEIMDLYEKLKPEIQELFDRLNPELSIKTKHQE